MSIIQSMPLDGHRLTLYPINEFDVPLISQWLTDPQLTKYFSDSSRLTAGVFESWVSRPDPIFMIVDNASSSRIGISALYGVSAKRNYAISGTVIGDGRFRSKGYATEAKMIILRMAFCSLKLQFVLSRVHRDNASALNLV